MSAIVDTVKSVLDNVGTILKDDTDLADKISKAGGLVGLVGLGVQLYRKAQDNARSPAEKAFAALLSFSFRLAEDSLKELLKPMEYGEITLEKGQTLRIMKDLLRPFKNDSDWNPYTTSDWNSYLPLHPVLRGMKAKISSLVESKIREFHYNIFRFKTERVLFKDRLFEVDLNTNYRPLDEN